MHYCKRSQYAQSVFILVSISPHSGGGKWCGHESNTAVQSGDHEKIMWRLLLWKNSHKLRPSDANVGAICAATRIKAPMATPRWEVFFEVGAEGHTNRRVHIFICAAALLFFPPPPTLSNEIRLLSDLCHTPSLFPQITEFYHEKIKRPHGCLSSPQEAVDNLPLCFFFKYLG